MKYKCDNCGKIDQKPASKIKGKKRLFCSRKCYSIFRATKLPKEEQHAWAGGVDPRESRRRWYEKNKKKQAAMARARKLREMNAPGSHTPAEWEKVKISYNNTCALHDDTCSGRLTKDHIIPLIMGGSNDSSNLQPLCQSHNSRKAHKVYTGKFETVNQI